MGRRWVDCDWCVFKLFFLFGCVVVLLCVGWCGLISVIWYWLVFVLGVDCFFFFLG